MEKFFVSTPIYYINGEPHIGHAYTTIAADVLARFYRDRNYDVFFLTGADEHGAKICEAAQKVNQTPNEFVDGLDIKFKAAWKNLNISNDAYIRTTNPEHEKLVQEMVSKLQDKGFVEKRQYEGLYCVGCEKFVKESELVDGKCSDHQKEPVLQKEENYFFRLSDFAEKILAKIESNELVIAPETRRNEVISKIKQGLEDVSISRQAVDWGIKFPQDESQTIYVWIDALLNYYTATKIFDKVDFWPANLHIVGKDILWFHAVIWPAVLLALDLPLPKKVFVQGYFTVNGQKMSKSVGNVIDPNKLVEKYGADAVRFALLREFPFGEDGDISEEKVAVSYTRLANNIGNLVQRTLSMINQYDIDVKTNQTNGEKIAIDTQIKNLDFYGALKKIDEFSENLNKFIAEKEPWILAKEKKQKELALILTKVYIDLHSLNDALKPFIPETNAKIAAQLKDLKPIPLFPKIG